mmetsp:Transcript_127281/g.247965  ORF Transcript_127281/g.247965 Transcript_127281/m.247965 type:complete len:82 (+) Transcript_127281:623-868(+)
MRQRYKLAQHVLMLPWTCGRTLINGRHKSRAGQELREMRRLIKIWRSSSSSGKKYSKCPALTTGNQPQKFYPPQLMRLKLQ